MNKVIFTFSVIVSAGLGYFAGKNSNDSRFIEAAPEHISEYGSSKSPVVAAPPQTKHENNFHAGVEASSSAQASSPVESASMTSQLAQEQIDAVKAEYEFRQRSEEFTQWLTAQQKEKAWFDLGIEMRGRFDAEEKDHSWALEKESHLQNIFSQAPALAGVALKSTQCKSTQCQITVSVMDNDHANETAMAISQVLGSEGAAQIIIDSQVQQGEATFYIARNEKGFEFN